MNKYDQLYINIANEVSKLSYATRNKVGSILVKDNNIISFGYNGMPHGFDNTCENESGNTNIEVLHAESNVITKVAKSNNSSIGSTLYTTLSPCLECAKLIHQSGIIRVIYAIEYRNLDGLDLLKKCNISINKLTFTN